MNEETLPIVVCEECGAEDHTTQQHHESLAVQVIMQNAQYMEDDELDALLDEVTQDN